MEFFGKWCPWAYIHRLSIFASYLSLVFIRVTQLYTPNKVYARPQNQTLLMVSSLLSPSCAKTWNLKERTVCRDHRDHIFWRKNVVTTCLHQPMFMRRVQPGCNVGICNVAPILLPRQTWALPGTWGKGGQEATQRKNSRTWKKKNVLCLHCLRRRDLISRLLEGFYSMEKMKHQKSWGFRRKLSALREQKALPP